MKYKDRPYKGILDRAHTKWSQLDATAPMHNDIRFDASKLALLTKYIIEHTFVQHEGTVYKLTTGVAMGVRAHCTLWSCCGRVPSQCKSLRLRHVEPKLSL
jgi:hypothetical protein